MNSLIWKRYLNRKLIKMEIVRKKIIIGFGFLVLIGLSVMLFSKASVFVKGGDVNGSTDNIINSENINNENLEENSDSDADGLADRLEKSIGADINKNDTDGDGYPDLEEVENGYSPIIAAPSGKMLPEEFSVLKEKIKNIDTAFYEKIFASNDLKLFPSPVPINTSLSGPAVFKEEISLSNKKWKYSFYAPADVDLNKKLTLVIGLHGFEGKAADYMKFWKSDADKNGFLVAVLQAYSKTYPGGSTVVAYPWLEISEFAKAVLVNVEKKYAIDENKIFLTGYSSGAAASYIIALDGGIKFKGVIPINGYLPLEAGIVDKLSKAKDVNFYVVHGANDTDVKSAISQEKILLQYGAKMEFKTLKGVGREYPAEEHENIIKWMNGLQ